MAIAVLSMNLRLLETFACYFIVARQTMSCTANGIPEHADDDGQRGTTIPYGRLAGIVRTSAAEYDPEVDFECPTRDMYVIVPVCARGRLRCKRPYRV